ncbi:MAG: HIT family protein [Crocinitomicaceae bacterium]|nr:HIT family protein [Crocinitomicaceae bacterium]
MATLFSKIVAGEIPCHKVHESDKFLAFLDIMPLREGHVLVIPKEEVDYIFDVEDNLLGEMMIFAKGVAKKIERVFPCNRIGVTVIGLEVPHAHIHLIPIDRLTDMDFTKEKMTISSERLTEIATAIAEA